MRRGLADIVAGHGYQPARGGQAQFWKEADPGYFWLALRGEPKRSDAHVGWIGGLYLARRHESEPKTADHSPLSDALWNARALPRLLDDRGVQAFVTVLNGVRRAKPHPAVVDSDFLEALDADVRTYYLSFFQDVPPSPSPQDLSIEIRTHEDCAAWLALCAHLLPGALARFEAETPPAGPPLQRQAPGAPEPPFLKGLHAAVRDVGQRLDEG